MLVACEAFYELAVYVGARYIVGGHVASNSKDVRHSPLTIGSHGREPIRRRRSPASTAEPRHPLGRRPSAGNGRSGSHRGKASNSYASDTRGSRAVEAHTQAWNTAGR